MNVIGTSRIPGPSVQVGVAVGTLAFVVCPEPRRGRSRLSKCGSAVGLSILRLLAMPTPTIMLAVHCKRSEPVDLRDPILDYVQRTYGAQVSLRFACLTISRARDGLHRFSLGLDSLRPASFASD